MAEQERLGVPLGVSGEIDELARLWPRLPEPTRTALLDLARTLALPSDHRSAAVGGEGEEV